MVTAKWRWRLRRVGEKPAKFDVQALKEKSIVANFDSELEQITSKSTNNAGGLYGRMARNVYAAMETALPKLEKKKGKVRERSDKTKDLFELRERVCAGLTKGSKGWLAARRK